ncbi:MAG TPA: haloacid dehalogenase-like hydrolase [Actinomycetota bacterium]
MSRSLPVAAVLVDFDGTACAHDVAEHLLLEFGDPSWPSYDEAVERGEIGLRDSILAQAPLLRADDRTLLSYALEHCRMDATFGPFVERCAAEGVPVTLVSDGFGFYIEPLLRAHGIGGVDVISNTWRGAAETPPMSFANGHPACVGCGTCKMLAVATAREALGPVAFVGDGQTDRYGALYADVVFAKRELATSCARDGVPFVPWEDFDDVLRALERSDGLPGPVSPVSCPGWTPA